MSVAQSESVLQGPGMHWLIVCGVQGGSVQFDPGAHAMAGQAVAPTTWQMKPLTQSVSVVQVLESASAWGDATSAAMAARAASDERTVRWRVMASSEAGDGVESRRGAVRPSLHDLCQNTAARFPWVRRHSGANLCHPGARQGPRRRAHSNRCLGNEWFLDDSSEVALVRDRRPISATPGVPVPGHLGSSWCSGSASIPPLRTSGNLVVEGCEDVLSDQSLVPSSAARRWKSLVRSTYRTGARSVTGSMISPKAT